MNRTNFFDGMEVSANDLQYSQAALIQQIKKSRTDFAGKGVLSAVMDYVQLDAATLSNGTPTIRILPFTAYNNTGERLETTLVFGLALDLTDSSNRQLGEQGELPLESFGWEDGATYQICAKYIERGARPLPQETTAIPYASRVYSGFEFYALRKGVDSLIENGENPYIILAEATYNETDTTKTLQITNLGITQYSVISGSKVGTTPSNTRTQTYDPQNLDNSANPQTISLDAHIHAINDINAVSATNPHGITAEALGVDTKSVPTHEKLFHSNGLLAGSEGVATTTSGFYTTVVPRVSLVDFLKVYNLASDELLHYKGNTLKYFINSTIESVHILLSDDSGIWPDGEYKLYVSTATSNLFIVVPNTSSAVNRKYTIYNSATNEVVMTATPLAESSINADIHYLLYTFSFSNVKGVSTVFNSSNYLTLRDYRTFGSISADNLQRNANNIFEMPYPLKVSELQFSDNSTLTSSIGILKYSNISNCILASVNGPFSVGIGADADKIIIHAGLSILCANGITSQGACNSIPATYEINKASTNSIPTVEGTYYVLVGKPTGEQTQYVYFSDNYIVSDIVPSNVVGNSPCWYNPDLNEIRFYTDSSWSEPNNLTKLGYIKVDSLGNVSDVNTDSPIRLLGFDTLTTILQGIDYVVETWTSGDLWYRKYRSGWIEQGGTYLTNLSNPQTVLLNTPFATTTYGVQLTKCQNWGEPGAQSMTIVNDSKTTTNFQVYGNDGSSTRRMYAFYWEAKGF